MAFGLMALAALLLGDAAAARRGLDPRATLEPAPVTLPAVSLDPADGAPAPRADAAQASPPDLSPLTQTGEVSPAPSGEDRGTAASGAPPRQTPIADRADEREASAAEAPFEKTRTYAYDEIILDNAAAPVPRPPRSLFGRLLDRRAQKRQPAPPLARGAIADKAEFAARLEPLLPWGAMDQRRDRKLPSYGEGKRWRAYLEALKHPAPIADRVVVFRASDRDSLLETPSGLANLSYFLVKERKGGAGNADLIAAARDIWARLEGTTNSIGLHTVDEPEAQFGMLRSSPWISTTRSLKSAPTFRPDPKNRVEVIVIDPRLLFATSSWAGESESLTPFAVWPEDLAAAMPARDFSAHAVRSALRAKFGAAAESLIAKSPQLSSERPRP